MIITFYSYKGGVGRSMALANIGVLLSKKGYKVLLLDWDLEAPGLENFFKEYIDISFVQSQIGIVDLIEDHIRDKKLNWKDGIIQLPILKEESTGCLHLITSGKREYSFYKKVTNIDFTTFFEKNGGGDFIENLRNAWNEEYDFVLVDSRTGVTDIGGICTTYLPDMVALFFTTTEQSLYGILHIGKKINDNISRLPYDRYNILTLPIPSRFDSVTEFAISQAWLNRLSVELLPLVEEWLPIDLQSPTEYKKILEQIKIPYVPYFSFGEKVAVLEQGTDDPASIGYICENITALIINRLANIDFFLKSRDSYIAGIVHQKNDTAKLSTFKDPARCLSFEQPAVTLYFVGRDIELVDIKEKLHKYGMILLSAEGGMGKTSIAAKYLEQNINNYKYYAWLFCENGIIEQLKVLAPNLGIDLTMYNSEESQLLAIKTALENIGKDCLLILDGANEPKHIESLIKYFSGIHTHIIITSRCQNVLPKENEYSLSHLKPEEAKQFFKGNYDEKTNVFEKLLDKFLTAIGYNTLMIELFSKNLHELSALGETMETTLQHFEEKGLYLGNKSFEIQTAYTSNVHKQAASTDDIINVIYDLTKLEENERYILVNLALLPAENHQLKTLLEAFEPEDNFAFTKQLKSLVKKGWLNTNTYSYRMSPVIQQVGLEKNKKRLNKDSQILIKNLTFKLEHNHGSLVNLKSYDEAQPFAFMAQSLLGLLLNDSFEVGLLAFNLSDYYKGIGNFASSIRELEVATAIFKKINKENYSICLERLGDIYQQQGDFKKALQFFKKYNELGIELVKDNSQDESFKYDLSVSYEKLGTLYQQLGDLKRAMQFFEQATHLMKELIETNPQSESIKYGLSISYEKLGDIYQQLGNFETALQFFEQDTELMKELFESNTQSESIKNGLSISYEKLGSIYQKQGDLNKALQFFEKHNELRKELFETNPQSESIKNGLAMSYSKLGKIYHQEGDFKKALQFFQQDAELMNELVEANPDSVSLHNGLAVSFIKLGNIYEELQELERVKNYYLKAEAILVELTERVPEAVEFTNNLAWVREQLAVLKS